MKPTERSRFFSGTRVVRRKNRGYKILTVILLIVLLIITAKIVLWMQEYRAGSDYYDSLRSFVGG